MKYRTSRQLITQKVLRIVLREIRRYRIVFPTLNKKKIYQLKKILCEIEQRGLPRKFCLKKLPGNIGHGIFLRADAKAIPKGAIIAPYGGVASLEPQFASDDAAYAFEVVDNMYLSKKEQKTFHPCLPFRPARKYSLKLDGEKRGNFTRFINHSFEPNVEAVIYKIPQTAGLEFHPAEILYIAKKPIRPGEQLLVCYEGEKGCYWKDMEPFFMNPTTFTVS